MSAWQSGADLWTGRRTEGGLVAQVTKTHEGYWWSVTHKGRVIDEYGPYYRGDFARDAADEALDEALARS